MVKISHSVAAATLLTLAMAGQTTLAKDMRVPDAGTRALLQRAEFESVRISPDGDRLAIARRTEAGTIVTIHRREDLSVLTSLDPGKGGEISELRWLDDDRLLVGAVRNNQTWGVPLTDPALYIVRVDGSDTFKLPANFFTTIDDDPDHLLVVSCARVVTDSCTLEVRKAEIGKLRSIGDLVIAAPDDHSTMRADLKGNVRFAISWEDDGSAKTYIHTTGTDGWKMVNDSAKTDIYLDPIGVSADGKTGFVVAYDAKGPSTVERFDFATEARTPIYTDPTSDPLRFLHSIHGYESIGAIYDATRPRFKFWNPEDEDSKLMAQVAAAFPSELAFVTSASEDKTKLIVYVYSDNDPGRYFFLDRTANKASLLVAIRPWLDSSKLGKQRAFTVTARDGLTLQGVLTLPPGSDGHGLPMVVLPHGGPYDVIEKWGFDSEAQILATHGYAVLQVNFRGSGGYGEKFVRAGFKQWGRAMQDDVTDATKWAIREGIADPDRVCIYGASYGGYSALMGVAREPGLYRCAVGMAGVYDLNKMYKWGSIHRTDLGKLYLNKVLGTDEAELDANSPAALADKINVPVLLAHGHLDPRVDIKQAELMKRMLSRNGKQVEFVEYTYERHGFSREEDRQDFYARLLEFLAKNLPTSAPATASSD